MYLQKFAHYLLATCIPPKIDFFPDTILFQLFYFHNLILLFFLKNFNQFFFTWQNCFICTCKNLLIIFWQRVFHQRLIFFPDTVLFQLFYFHHLISFLCHNNLHTSAFVLYPDVLISQFSSQLGQSISKVCYKKLNQCKNAVHQKIFISVYLQM